MAAGECIHLPTMIFYCEKVRIWYPTAKDNTECSLPEGLYRVQARFGYKAGVLLRTMDQTGGTS